MFDFNEFDLTKKIRELLTKWSVDLTKYEETSEERISWCFWMADGLSIYISLYHSKKVGYTYFTTEAAITKISNVDDLACRDWILKNQETNYLPLKLMLLEDNTLVIKTSMVAEEVKSDYLTYQIEAVVNIGNEVLRDVCVKFGYRPYYEIYLQEKKNDPPSTKQ